MNAFDNALVDAKIAQGNLVPVSSILPKNCKKLDRVPEFIPGTILYCILAKTNGSKGERIGVGIGYALSNEYGVVAEAHGQSTEAKIRELIAQELKGMTTVRKINTKETYIETKTIERIKEKYGCAIAALVFS